MADTVARETCMRTAETTTVKRCTAPAPLHIGPVSVDPPLLQAPMAGYTNHAFRQIVRRLGGVGLVATEMVNARGFREIDRRGQGIPQRLWGIAGEPRPLAVQIWDNRPEELAEVGRRLVGEFGVSVVDINFGCPVPVVSEKAESGSYLLRFPERIGRIVERVAAACRPAPVTAKIRLGWSRDTINTIDVAQAVEGAGGAALTVHGRTAGTRFGGSADWDAIARVKPHLRRIPLIGNGDLRTAESVAEAFARYGVDGAMIGRAAVSRPWIFREAACALAGEPVPPGPTRAERLELLLAHYRLVLEQFGSRRGTILMRKLACGYARGEPHARAFRTSIDKATTPEEFVALARRYFAD
jgi:tRNA-dihydrouridine synthase B